MPLRLSISQLFLRAPRLHGKEAPRVDTRSRASGNAVERYLAEARQVRDRCTRLHGRGRRDLRLRGDVTTGDALLFPQVAHQRANVLQQFLILHQQLVRSRLKREAVTLISTYRRC